MASGEAHLMASGIKIDVRATSAALDRLIQNSTNTRPLLKAIGLRQLRWIDQNFRSGGRLIGGWKRLSPNTIAGRRRGSRRPLRDTGRLQQSFTSRAGARQVRVGTQTRYAAFHEQGTRPFTIRPKTKKALAFPTAGGPVKLKNTKIRHHRGRQGVVTAGPVNHPGIPRRPMLPTPRIAQDLATRVAVAIITRNIRRFNRGSR